MMQIDKSANVTEIPGEHFRWMIYEVILPIAVPIVVFVVLWVAFSQDREKARGAVDALVAVAGSGDLLVFGALLLLNVSSSLLFEKEEEHGSSVSASTANGHITLICGVLLLLGYSAIRIFCHTAKNPAISDLQFLFGIGSLIALFLAMKWADYVLCSMYLRRLERQFNHGKIRGQYNFE